MASLLSMLFDKEKVNEGRNQVFYVGYTTLEKVSISAYRISLMTPVTFGALGLLVYLEFDIKERTVNGLYIDPFWPDLYELREDTVRQIFDLEQLLKNKGVTIGHEYHELQQLFDSTRV